MSDTESLRINVITFDCAPFSGAEPAQGAAAWTADAQPARFVPALADTLAARGLAVTLTLPLFEDREIPSVAMERQPVPPVAVRFGRDLHHVRAWQSSVGRQRVPVRLLECAAFFGTAVPPGGTSSGARRGFFARAVLQSLRTQAERRPGILHCQGVSTAPLPVMLKIHHGDERVYAGMRTVLTLHDGAMRDRGDDPNLLPLVGFTPDRFYPLGPFESGGRLSFTKAALAHADLVTALSAGHARALERSELLRSLASVGVPRVVGLELGLDTRDWDPSTDPLVPAAFSAADASGRVRCREALVMDFGLPAQAGAGLVLAHVGPLTRDAGSDLLIEAAPALVAAGATLVVVGAGDAAIEERISRLAREHAGRIAVRLTADTHLARGVLAGADACLLPSRHEVTATRALQALRYGAVPVAAPAEGFTSVVRDASEGEGNGFLAEGLTAAGLVDAVARLRRVQASPDRWEATRRAALAADVSWDASAAEYERRFRGLVPHDGPRGGG